MTETGFYENETQIKDPSVAHELAIIEATMGRDKALAREQELKRLHETGLTDQERQIIVINESLIAKYPHAFSVDIGVDGKVYYDTKPPLEGREWLDRYSKIVLTPDGFLVVSSNGGNTRLDESINKELKSKRPSEIVTLFNENKERDYKKGNSLAMYVEIGGGKSYPCRATMTDPIKGDINFTFFQRNFNKAEEDHAKLEKETMKAVASVENILSKL